MFSEEEEYLLGLEKEKRDKIAEIGNSLITYLQNSFTGKISANRETVIIFITSFYKDVDNKEDMSNSVLQYIERMNNL